MNDPLSRQLLASTHRAELHRTAPVARPARRAPAGARRPITSWFAGLRRRPVAPLTPRPSLAGRPG